jgi:hypothetical protein
MEKWIRAYAALALIAVASLLTYELIPWATVNRQDWPAWVQAVGSIAAIVAAFFLGERQAAKARKDAIDIVRIELRNKKDAIVEICRAAKMRSDLVRDVFVTNFLPIGRYEVYDHKLIQGVIAGLESAPVYEIGNAKAINAFLDIGLHCGLLMQTIDQLDQDEDVRTAMLFPSMPSPRLVVRQRAIAAQCDRIDALVQAVSDNIFISSSS